MAREGPEEDDHFRKGEETDGDEKSQSAQSLLEGYALTLEDDENVEDEKAARSPEMIVLDMLKSATGAKRRRSPESSPLASASPTSPAMCPSSPVPEKARKVLGMDEELPPAAVRAMVETSRRRAREQMRVKEEVTQARPSPAQLAIPHADRRVSDKALRVLGDENLAQASCRLVVNVDRENAAKHPKVIKMLGEPVLASPKALKRCGSDMHVNQRRAQIEEETREQAKRASEAQRCLQTVLRLPPTPEQLELPGAACERPVPEKALRFFGEDCLEKSSQRVVTETMRKNVCPKTLHMLGDSALLQRKERQILGSLDQQQRVDAPWRQRLLGTLRALSVM